MSQSGSEPLPEVYQNCRDFSRTFLTAWKSSDTDFRNSANSEGQRLALAYDAKVIADRTSSDEIKGQNARDFVRELYNKDPGLFQKHLLTNMTGVDDHGQVQHFNQADVTEFLHNYVDSNVALPPPPRAPILAPGEVDAARNAIGSNHRPVEAITDFWSNHSWWSLLGMAGAAYAGVTELAGMGQEGVFGKMGSIVTIIALAFGGTILANMGSTDGRSSSNWLGNGTPANHLHHYGQAHAVEVG